MLNKLAIECGRYTDTTYLKLKDFIELVAGVRVNKKDLQLLADDYQGVIDRSGYYSSRIGVFREYSTGIYSISVAGGFAILEWMFLSGKIERSHFEKCFSVLSDIALYSKKKFEERQRYCKAVYRMEGKL